MVRVAKLSTLLAPGIPILPSMFSTPYSSHPDSSVLSFPLQILVTPCRIRVRRFLKAKFSFLAKLPQSINGYRRHRAWCCKEIVGPADRFQSTRIHSVCRSWRTASLPCRLLGCYFPDLRVLYLYIMKVSK